MAEFEDKKIRLVVFGILQIVLGSFCALLIPLMIFGAMVSRTKSPDNFRFRTMIPAILMYSLASIWFIFMGIGSIMTRRWARALILISSWIWLICGTLGSIFVLGLILNMFKNMGENSQVPEAARIVMIFMMILFLALFYIIIPGLLILFYSGRNVKMTFEFRDTKIRWTDKCPLPVLAVSFITAVWAISMFGMAMYNWTIPFFGNVLSGRTGEIIIVLYIALFAYIAYGTYRLDMKGWWTAFLAIIFWSISTIITFVCRNIQDYYDKMGISGQQLESIKNFGTMFGSSMIYFIASWSLIILAYLIYIRRYFKSAPLKKKIWWNK